MGCSPKNVQGERGGCKGAFIQTTVGTEAGDDFSDPHTFSILRGLRRGVECFPAGPLPPQRQGHCRAGRIPLIYQTLARCWLEFSSLNTFFIMKSSHLSLARSTVCSHIVLLSWGWWMPGVWGTCWGQAHKHIASQAGWASILEVPLEAHIHLWLPDQGAAMLARLGGMLGGETL